MRSLPAAATPSRRPSVLVVTLLSLASAPALPAQALEPADERPRVIARVNGEALYAEDLESVLGEIHRSQQVEQRADFDVDALLFRLVNDTLLAQEARTLGMHESAEIQRRVANRRESRARARVLREEIGERLTFDEEAARQVYADIFRVASLRVITRYDRAEIEALRPKVAAAKDGESFAKLAQESSQDPYSARGGKIEAPLASLFASLIEFATSAEAGQVSPTMATPWGWSLVRLERLDAADLEQFEPRRARVLAELRHRQETVLRLALAERLRPMLGLEVDWAVFETIGVQRMHDGRLLPQFEGAERTVAKVAGRTITAKDFAGKLASTWSVLSNPTLALESRRGVLDDLIFEELLIAEGLRRGYGDTPEVKRELHALEMSQLASRYLKEFVASGVEVTPQEMRDYFDNHREEFRKPPRIHLLQLTVATEAEAVRIAELAKGGADFGWLVRRYSIDSFRDTGGDRGWVLANQGIALFRAELQNAVAGDVVGPKQGPAGWVVLKVDLYEDQGLYEFQAVSGNVESELRNGKIVERIDKLIRALRERSEIWVDQEAVAALSILPAMPEAKPAVPGHDGG
jgi:peptidyl-prolyl cis-trans isomerase C